MGVGKGQAPVLGQACATGKTLRINVSRLRKIILPASSSLPLL